MNGYLLIVQVVALLNVHVRCVECDPSPEQLLYQKAVAQYDLFILFVCHLPNGAAAAAPRAASPFVAPQRVAAAADTSQPQHPGAKEIILTSSSADQPQQPLQQYQPVAAQRRPSPRRSQ